MPRALLISFGRYLTVIALGNLVWEMAQMPLYTLWVDGSWAQIGFAVAHCTLGDVLIGAITLSLALVLWRAKTWPRQRFGQVGAATMILALAYTIFSEWWNVDVRQTWAYRDIMPTLPWLGTGISPLLQWVVVPLLALQFARSARLDT
jgi:hypothetical protein